MKKIAPIFLLIPFALAGGLFYGLIAHKLFRDREPWFTSFMLFGLAVSVCVMAWASGASHTSAIWVFLSTGALYLVARLVFGKGSALEMFFAPHLLALMILMFLPALKRAHDKVSRLQELRPKIAAAKSGRRSGLIEKPQVVLRCSSPGPSSGR